MSAIHRHAKTSSRARIIHALPAGGHLAKCLAGPSQRWHICSPLNSAINCQACLKVIAGEAA